MSVTVQVMFIKSVSLCRIKKREFGLGKLNYYLNKCDNGNEMTRLLYDL